MQFHVDTCSVTPDLDAVNDAVTALDPAAVIDFDTVTGLLRISAELNALELLATLAQGGFRVKHQQLRQLPSICCGDCSG